VEIPGDARERRELYINAMRAAELASRTERRDRFRKFRALQLTGTETTDRARYNALREWVRRSSSMIYNAKGILLDLIYPPYYGGQDPARLTTDEIEHMTEIAREELTRMWMDSDMPTVCGQAVAQAHYADTSLVKLFVSRNEVSLGLIADPSDVCVGDERLPWSQQEVICHFYSVSLPYFRRLIQGVPDARRRAAMWDSAKTQATRATEARGEVLPGALPRLILASASPTLVGSVVNTTDTMLAQPKSREEVVTLCEIWIWDDAARRLCAQCYERRGSWRHHEAWVSKGVGHAFEDGDTAPDWRVVTIFDPTLDILWDPINPLGIDGHAFFPLCLEPDSQANYIWGVCPMETLIGPQMEHEQILAQDAMRDELDVNPPMSFYGVGGSRDGEMSKGWRKPGADIQLTSPHAKVEFHRPPPLPDKYDRGDRVQARMRLLQGIPKAMTGETDPSMRAGEQMQSAAMLGAGPTLDHAMVVESWVEAIATAAFRVQRNILDRPLVKDDGSRFLLRQMPGDFVAHVWSHTTSPVYSEHITQKAVVAKKLGVIDDEDFLLYLNLPNTDKVRRKSKKLAKAKAESQEKVIELKDREVRAKEAKALKP